MKNNESEQNVILLVEVLLRAMKGDNRNPCLKPT